MTEGEKLAVNMILFFVVGLVADGLGVSWTGDVPQPVAPPAPAGGIVGTLQSILLPLKWAWLAVSAVFLLIAFPISGVHPMVSALVGLWFGYSVLWKGVKLIRGVG